MDLDPLFLALLSLPYFFPLIILPLCFFVISNPSAQQHSSTGAVAVQIKFSNPAAQGCSVLHMHVRVCVCVHKGPDVSVYIVATAPSHTHTHTHSNISTASLLLDLPSFLVERTTEPVVRSWSGFSAQSGKQQLDERCWREDKRV